MIEIKGKLARKLRFWGQLRAKLEKFTVKVYFAKDAELWGPIWLKSGVKLKKIKSLIVSVGSNFKYKTKDQIEKDVEIKDWFWNSVIST